MTRYTDDEWEEEKHRRQELDRIRKEEEEEAWEYKQKLKAEEVERWEADQREKEEEKRRKKEEKEERDRDYREKWGDNYRESEGYTGTSISYSEHTSSSRGSTCLKVLLYIFIFLLVTWILGRILLPYFLKWSINL